MALTKSSASILSAVTSTQTSSAVDISASYESTIYAILVQSGGTASSAATYQVQYSVDGTNYYNGPTYAAGTANGSYYWLVDVPDDTTHIKIAYTQPGSNTGTFTAQVGKITGL